MPISFVFWAVLRAIQAPNIGVFRILGGYLWRRRKRLYDGEDLMVVVMMNS
jgi:hypothetical protein